MISWSSNPKINNILLNYWNGKLPVDIFSIAQNLNVAPNYDKDDPIHRIRFTIAHQLIHYLYQDKHCSNCHLVQNAFSSRNRDYYESRANKLAVELLVPSDALRIAITGKGISSIEELSQLFNVSEAAIYFQLKKYNFIL